MGIYKMSFKEKYFKYKKKYLILKSKIGGAASSDVVTKEIVFNEDTDEWEVDSDVNEAISSKFSDFPNKTDDLGNVYKVYYQDDSRKPKNIYDLMTWEEILEKGINGGINLILNEYQRIMSERNITSEQSNEIHQQIDYLNKFNLKKKQEEQSKVDPDSQVNKELEKQRNELKLRNEELRRQEEEERKRQEMDKIREEEERKRQEEIDRVREEAMLKQRTEEERKRQEDYRKQQEIRMKQEEEDKANREYLRLKQEALESREQKRIIIERCAKLNSLKNCVKDDYCYWNRNRNSCFINRATTDYLNELENQYKNHPIHKKVSKEKAIVERNALYNKCMK